MMAPQYLHYENANGRTPMEIATSQYLLDIASHPQKPAYRLHHESVVDQQLFKFYPEEETPEKTISTIRLPFRSDGSTQLDGSAQESGDMMDVDEEETEEEKPKDNVTHTIDWQDIKDTYRFAVKAVEKFPGKRKLVSLLDANELAKRITGKKNVVPITEFNGGDILCLWN